MAFFKKRESFVELTARIEDNTSQNELKQSSLLNAIVAFLMASCVMLSLLFAAERIGYFAVSATMLAAVFVATAFFTATYMLLPRKWLLVLTSHLGIVVLIWYFYEKIFDGGVILVREMIMMVNKYYQTSYLYPKLPMTFKKEEALFFAVLILILVISSLLCFSLSKGKGAVICGLITLGVFFVCVNLSNEDIYLPIFMALCPTILSLMLYKGVPSGKTKKMFCLNLRTGIWGRALSVTLAFTVLIGGTLLAFSPYYATNPYIAPFAEASRSPKAFYEHLTSFDFLRQLSVNLFSEGSGVGGGMLNVGSRSKGLGRPALQVTVPSADKDKLSPYLKGYTGAIYNDEKRRFEDLPSSVYEENANLFSDFESEKLTPMSLSKGYFEKASKNQSVKETRIFINNISANKNFLYLPYFLTSDYFNNSSYQKSDFVNDSHVSGKRIGNGTYSASMMIFADGATDYAKENLLEDRSGAASAYSEFVYKNYLTFPAGLDRVKAAGEGFATNFYKSIGDETSNTAEINSGFSGDNSFVKIVGEEDEQAGKTDEEKMAISVIQSQNGKGFIGYVTYCIKEYLQSHAVYDLACGDTPAEKDFVEYFLYENHKGYCVHFATAATLLFRAAGVPSRYVEGYIMTDENLNVPDIWKIIPDSNAHAWVEVWDDTLGWVPVEATPGFSQVAIAPQDQNVQIPPEILDNTSSEEVSSEASSEEVSSEEAVSSEAISSKGESSGQSEPSASSNGGTAEGTKAKELSFGTKFLLVFVAMLILLIGIVWAIYRFVERKREKRVWNKDKNVAYRYGYAYLLELLGFVDIVPENGESDEEFAKRADDKFAFLENRFLGIVQSAYLAKFSQHSIEPSAVDELIAFNKGIREKIYNDLSVVKKILFVYIFHL